MPAELLGSIDKFWEEIFSAIYFSKFLVARLDLENLERVLSYVFDCKSAWVRETCLDASVKSSSSVLRLLAD